MYNISTFLVNVSYIAYHSHM